jgi:hypothetical protein
MLPVMGVLGGIRRDKTSVGAHEVCERHAFEQAAHLCRSCGLNYCQECLVWPRGPKRPPMCITCALNRGVRH